MPTIGFIGLGTMGGPMAGNLCRKGSSLVVFDVVPERMRTVEALGARAAADVVGVAAESDVVFTMLPASADVVEVVGGPNGLIARGRKGSLIVDMSTIDPLVTDRLAMGAAACGIAFADAPVGRLASHAARGESLFMVGAADETFAKIRPFPDEPDLGFLTRRSADRRLRTRRLASKAPVQQVHEQLRGVGLIPG